MKLYRVSQESPRSIGGLIWEAGNDAVFAELRRATDIFLCAIKEHDHEYIKNTFEKENLRKKFTGSYLEAVWEYVRETKFPEFPVRYENMMLFRTFEEAQSFKQRYRKDGAVLYEVEINDPKYFLGDMRILDEVTGYDLADLIKIATRYWSGTQTDDPLWEVVLYPDQKAIITGILN